MRILLPLFIFFTMFAYSNAATLYVSASMPCEVYVNHHLVGTTPYTGGLFPGHSHIRVKCIGNDRYMTEVLPVGRDPGIRHTIIFNAYNGRYVYRCGPDYHHVPHWQYHAPLPRLPRHVPKIQDPKHHKYWGGRRKR